MANCPTPVHISVSRRSFVRITVGAIALLPTVGSTLLLPRARKALADQDPAHNELAAGTEIYVVQSNELAIVVSDVSLPASAPRLIPGAHVRVTSRYNGNLCEGYTDDEGAVCLDISDLCEDDGKERKPAAYAFNAIIEVTADGYRTFRTGMYRIEGGLAMGVPTQPREENMPYPTSVSFDEWDVLYTAGEGAEFVCCTGNNIMHALVLEIENCKPGATVVAGLLGAAVVHAMCW